MSHIGIRAVCGEIHPQLRANFLILLLFNRFQPIFAGHEKFKTFFATQNGLDYFLLKPALLHPYSFFLFKQLGSLQKSCNQSQQVFLTFRIETASNKNGGHTAKCKAHYSPLNEDCSPQLNVIGFILQEVKYSHELDNGLVF